MWRENGEPCFCFIIVVVCLIWSKTANYGFCSAAAVSVSLSLFHSYIPHGGRRSIRLSLFVSAKLLPRERERLRYAYVSVFLANQIVMRERARDSLHECTCCLYVSRDRIEVKSQIWKFIFIFPRVSSSLTTAAESPFYLCRSWIFHTS